MRSTAAQQRLYSLCMLWSGMMAMAMTILSFGGSCCFEGAVAPMLLFKRSLQACRCCIYVSG